MTETDTADQLAIRNLYAAYTFAVDDHDADGFAACFTDAARIEVSSFAMMRDAMAAGKVPFVDADGWVIGIATIRKLSDMMPPDVTMLHITANVHIQKIEGGRATARAAFAVFGSNGVVEHYGRYCDQLEKCADGRWRFSERRDMARYERGDTAWLDEEKTATR